MTGRRSIVAVQAVIVGVLVVVVFLTLLRPEDRGRLFGIRGPGPEKQLRDGPRSENRKHPGQADQRRGSGARSRRGELALTGEAAAGSEALATPFRLEASPPLSAIGGAVGGRTATRSPSDEQYQDSITRLISRLNPTG